jgi:hypothetical protein
MKTTDANGNERFYMNNCCFTLIPQSYKMITKEGETIIKEHLCINIMNPKDNVFKTIPTPKDFTTLKSFVWNYFGYNKNFTC